MTIKEKIARLKGEIRITGGMIERYKGKLDDMSSHSFSTSFSGPDGGWSDYSEKIRDYERHLQFLEKELAELESAL